MTAFEVVVRPVVLPNIRPGRARQLPTQDDPDQGFATINGNGATKVTVTKSYSSSTSSSSQTETEAQGDEVRVSQKMDDGSINEKNFVDLRVRNKSKWMRSAGQSTYYWIPVDDGEGGTKIQKRNISWTKHGKPPGTNIRD